jgi:hypothetical protein
VIGTPIKSRERLNLLSDIKRLRFSAAIAARSGASATADRRCCARCRASSQASVGVHPRQQLSDVSRLSAAAQAAFVRPSVL